MSDRGPVLPVDRVAAELRGRVTAGEWAKDERLPSIPDLAVQHSTSRATVTKALHVLEAEGLVTVVRSWGTFKA